MNINLYRQLSPATLISKGDKVLDSLHFITGICSEIQHEYALAETIENQGEELGDACWYASQYCNTWGIITPDHYEIKPDTDLRVDELTILIGQLQDLDKAAFAYNREIPISDRTRIITRIFATIQMIIEGIGLELSDVLTANLEKLHVRYGEKFTAHAANNRDLEAELEVLRRNFKQK